MTDRHLNQPPSRSYWNNMETDHIEIPEFISDLNLVEKNMVSIVVPNMKIINLNGIYGQAKFHGQALCLPKSDSDEQLILPRNPNENLIINGNNNNLNNINKIKDFSIDKSKVIKTLEYLKLNNLKYKYIEIDYSFLNDENNEMSTPKSNIKISDAEKAVAVNKENIYKKSSVVLLNTLPSLSSNIESPGQYKNIMKFNKHNWINISNNINTSCKIIKGSFNQLNGSMFGRFAGLQCTAMALAAIVYAQCINPTLEAWNKQNIDQILVQGNCVYADIIGPLQQIRCLRVNELPQLPCPMYNKLIRITYDDASAYYGSTLGTTISRNQLDQSFKANLAMYFQNYNAGIIICNLYSRAIFKIENLFYIFDSHSCTLFSENAFCIKCDSIDEFADHLLMIIGSSQSFNYTIDIIQSEIINNNLNIDNDNNFNINNNFNDNELSNDNINIDNELSINEENTIYDNFLPLESIYIHNQDIDNLNINDVLNINNNLELVVNKNDLMKRPNVHRKNSNNEIIEEKVWFDLFPMGNCGLTDSDRLVKISTLDYFQTRLMSKNLKYQQNSEYLFYALHQFELERSNSNINILCKNIDNSFVNKLHMIERNIRGTQSYWAEAHSDLSAMIRAIGSPTFFCTFSANDLK
jgi:hypothetical protein